jgi:phage terminase large subunit-like protein
LRIVENSAASRDHVALAIEYAQQAADPKCKTVGKWIRLAAQRFLRDLERAKQPGAPFWWSPEHARDACEFIELLPHVEGTWETPTIVLIPAQCFFICQLFGFRAGEFRRFTTAVYATSRKSAKSTIAGAIALYCFTCEGEVGPQVISAATTRDQAGKVFDPAKKMVEKTAELREAFGLEPFVNSIVCTSNGGSFKPINAKASSQDGLNPSTCVMDEIHAMRTHDLVNVLTSAAGARKNPLFLYTTTEGYENPGPWSEIRKMVKLVLEQVVEAEHYLALYWAVDDADDDFDESCWIKANPLMDCNPELLKALRKEAIEAKQLPGKMAEFQIKRLNRPASAANNWIDLPKWRASGGDVPLDKLIKLPCMAGLDLAATGDMTAFWLVWKLDGKYYTWGTYWVPEESARQRTIRGALKFGDWIAQGHIHLTDGDVADYDQIERDIGDILARFNVRKVAYDKWNATGIVTRLQSRRIELMEFPQLPQFYHPAMQEFERAYVAGNLIHGNNPVLNWNAANFVARRDSNMNMAPDRKKSADKIDGICSVLMAMGLTLAEPTVTRGKVYAL